MHQIWKGDQAMSQESEILSFLKRGRALTPLEALNRFGTFRLSARILGLRRKGWDIETTMKKTRSGRGYYAEYRLTSFKQRQ